jgi:hypothetical protein
MVWMTAPRTSFLFFGILLGLVIFVMTGLGLVLVFLEETGIGERELSDASEELIDNREDLPGSGNKVVGGQKDFKGHSSLWPFSFPFFGSGQENEGNSFTGQAAGWLFGISSLPVAFCLSTRLINRQSFFPSIVKQSLGRFTPINKRILMPFHTYFGILGLIFGIFHLFFSSCPNPLPEWGLVIAGVLVLTGLMIKFRIAAKLFPRFVKKIYQFHVSLVVSGILIFVLLAGHILMD